MQRAAILSTAADIVTRDRAATHGNAENNFEATAMMWAALDKARGDRPRCAIDVALYLAGFKLIRASGNPWHEDSFVDAAGYSALAAEMALAEGGNA